MKKRSNMTPVTFDSFRDTHPPTRTNADFVQPEAGLVLIRKRGQIWHPSHLTLLETPIPQPEPTPTFPPEAGLVLIVKKRSNMTPVTFDSFEDTYLLKPNTTERKLHVDRSVTRVQPWRYVCSSLCLRHDYIRRRRLVPSPTWKADLPRVDVQPNWLQRSEEVTNYLLFEEPKK